MMDWTNLKAAILSLDAQQGMLLLCLLLVLLMLLALLLLYRRTQQAERRVREMTRSVSDQLAAADERARENGERAQREYGEAMQSVSDSIVRMMG